MRLLILGGTGSSGLLLISKAIETYPGSNIIVYARSPDKLPDHIKSNSSVQVVKGSLEELERVEEVVKGVGVVVSALGPWLGHPSGQPFAKFYEKLIDLMYKYGVKRLIVLSTASHSDSHDRFSTIFTGLVLGVHVVARSAYQDIVATGKVITSKGDGLDWTLVRVPVLTNFDTEEVVAGYVGDGKVGHFLSRKAFAAFCIKEIEEKKWTKMAPLISSPVHIR